jgi:hypothetical protein
MKGLNVVFIVLGLDRKLSYVSCTDKELDIKLSAVSSIEAALSLTISQDYTLENTWMTADGQTVYELHQQYREQSLQESI